MTDQSNITRNDWYWVAPLAALLTLAAPGCADSDQGAPVTLVSAEVANQFVEAHNAVRLAVTAPANYPGTWVALNGGDLVGFGGALCAGLGEPPA